MILRNTAAFMRHLRANRAAVAAGNVLACSGLVGFIACSDTGLTEPVAAPAVRATVQTSTAAVVANWWAPPAPIIHGDTTINTFTIDPKQGGIPTFGPGSSSRIVIPAGAICDRTTSGYGPAYWAKSCAPAQALLTFTVKTWFGRDGTPKVTFSPDIRFAPSQTVLLHISAGTAPLGTPTVMWCTSQITQCVDEGVTDPTAVASFDPYAWSVWRRVKHLSGYNVGWGKVGAAAANSN